jgi:hypothetical protein
VILGFVAMPFPKQWIGSRIYAGYGRIRPRNYTLPKQFGDYLFRMARKADRMKENISAAQEDKITAAYRRDLDRAAQSASFPAMDHDVRLFGRRAFQLPGPDTAEAPVSLEIVSTMGSGSPQNIGKDVARSRPRAEPITS